jgi:hypothetical protein
LHEPGAPQQREVLAHCREVPAGKLVQLAHAPLAALELLEKQQAHGVRQRFQRRGPPGKAPPRRRVHTLRLYRLFERNVK